MKSLRGSIVLKSLTIFVLLFWTTSLFSQDIPKTYQLDEVTIHGGVNPAHRIIDSVMLHRNDNNPNTLDAYRYQVYDQMVITAEGDTSQSKINDLLKNSDLMIMETVSEVLFQAPDKKRQNVLGTKMAGVKDQLFVYLGSELQSVDFYDETVQILGNDYVNPISRNSKKRYFFVLDSVCAGSHNDSLYVISFYPYTEANFKGLNGSLVISDGDWSLQQVKALPNDQGGLVEVSIEHQYQKVGDRWFPEQLNARLHFPQFVVSDSLQTFPMVALSSSHVKHVEVNPTIDKRAFSNVEVDVQPEAAYRDDAFWTEYRIDSLTERIVNTYHLMDSLTYGNNLLEWALGFANTLLEAGSIPLGPIDVNIDNMVRLSAMRGFYAGIHLSTNNHFSRHVRLSAYGGYWTRLRDFDYGAGAAWFINRRQQMELGLRYAHCSTPMGEFGGFSEGEGLLSEKAFRYTFYENVLVRGELYETYFNTRFARYFKMFITFGHYDKHYHEQYFRNPEELLPQGSFTNAEIKLRFAYNEKFKSTLNGLESLGTDYPILWLSYQHSFKDLFGGQYEFDRFKFQLEKDFHTRDLGTTSVLLQAGFATEGCPVMETFNILGSYERIGLYSPGCFATARESEFFCDRFVALFLSHDFEGTLWSPNVMFFRPQLSLVTNIGWGDMKRQGVFPEGNFKTMEHGLFESGIVVHGLLSTPTVSMGAGVFYRYGAYSHPKVFDNFAFKYSIKFNL